MINAAELRIGNYIMDFGIISKVTGHLLTYLEEINRSGKISNISTIPLDEEWLGMLGGKAKRTIGRPFYCYEFERFEVMSDGFNIDCFFHDHMHGTYHITFKKLHIHELQNLVFALEGVELVIL